LTSLLVIIDPRRCIGFVLGPGFSGLLSPQLTAFFTSAPILTSSAVVNFVKAKAVGHMAPSSRFAASLKPSVAYLVFELLRALEEADDLAVPGVRGHPVPELRRQGRRILRN
jgi:hypothetical protein